MFNRNSDTYLVQLAIAFVVWLGVVVASFHFTVRLAVWYARVRGWL